MEAALAFAARRAKLSAMSKTYTPGPEADAIIARQVAKGNFATPDEAVRAGVQLLEAQEAELEELQKADRRGRCRLRGR